MKVNEIQNNNICKIKDRKGNTLLICIRRCKFDYLNVKFRVSLNNNDNIKSVTLGNKVKSDYTYDGDGNVQSLVTVTQNGEVLVNYKYAYDLNGNRLQKISSKHKNYYSYDSMNRLVDSSYDDICERFTYDKVGNRLTKSTNNITEKYVYNIKNQLKELQKENSEILFTYDKQGNTIKEETNTGNNIFEYNTLNKSVKAITKEGKTLVNRYDSEGLRYEIYENEKLSKFIFHKGNVLVETDKDDNVVSRFTRGYDVVAADVSNEDLSSSLDVVTSNYDSTSRYYYSVDEQGSTIFITDKNQKVQNEYYYDAFGNIIDSKEEINNRITYTGQQFDGITQQYYLRARLYNPVIGRFTQEDIYRSDGLNLYAYCKSNPVGYYDPSGYACESKGRAVADGAQGVSKAEVNTAESIKNIINSKGYSVDEFSKLLHPNRILTDSEKLLVDSVRKEIGLPSADTLMCKTIPQSDIYKYLYNEYDEVRGFTAVGEHGANLNTLLDKYNGARLDYNNTAFKTTNGVDGISQSVGLPDKFYGTIEYKANDVSKISIPDWAPKPDGYPYTGKGFTGSTDVVLPEYFQDTRKFMNGDILNIVDTNTGKVVSKFKYNIKFGWIDFK